MSDELKAVLFTAVGGALAKALDVIIQWRKQHSEGDIASDRLVWEQTQYIVKQYQDDVKGVRAELAAVRAELAEVKRDRDNLQARVTQLEADKAYLQGELEAMKGREA